MLERSQDAPHEVALRSGQWEQENSARTLTIILHEIERIQTLDVICAHSSLLDTVHNILASFGRDWKASSLESLTINTNFTSAPRPASVKAGTLDVFRPTSLLHRLILSGGYYSWNMFPLPSLTHLGLRGASLSELSGAQLIETLCHMQNLEALSMDWEDGHICQFPPTPCPQPILLPSLRRLEICVGSQADLELFLSFLRCPRWYQLQVSPSSVVDGITFTNRILSFASAANFGPLAFLETYCEYVTISALLEISVDDDNETSSYISTCTLGMKQGLVLIIAPALHLLLIS